MSRFGFDKIISVSKEMQKILFMIEKLSENDSSTVLIYGESGIGKELIAHFIHYKSSRRSKGSKKKDFLKLQMMELFFSMK